MNYYAEAIHILKKTALGKIDGYELLYEIAKLNPSIVIKANDKINLKINEKSEILTTVTDYVKAGLKIQAIKKYREMTGCDLKKAKDTVDLIQKQLCDGLRPEAPRE